MEEQLLSEHWELPLIRASRAGDVDSADRRHGQHEPKPGHIQKSSAAGRPATVGFWFFWGGGVGFAYKEKQFRHCVFFWCPSKKWIAQAHTQSIIMFSGSFTRSWLVKTLAINSWNGVGCGPHLVVPMCFSKWNNPAKETTRLQKQHRQDKSQLSIVSALSWLVSTVPFWHPTNSYSQGTEYKKMPLCGINPVVCSD